MESVNHVLIDLCQRSPEVEQFRGRLKAAGVVPEPESVPEPDTPHPN